MDELSPQTALQRLDEGKLSLCDLGKMDEGAFPALYGKANNYQRQLLHDLVASPGANQKVQLMLHEQMPPASAIS